MRIIRIRIIRTTLLMMIKLEQAKSVKLYKTLLLVIIKTPFCAWWFPHTIITGPFSLLRHSDRRISYWLNVNDGSNDELQLNMIRDHRAAFTHVQPYTYAVPLDGNISNWWHNESAITSWSTKLKAMDLKVLPYVIDIDNATQMHLVYANATAVIADAVNVALHYQFDGFFIDYEDEYPRDTDPQAANKLRDFLTQFADALHVHGLELTICVASWSHLLGQYSVLAESSVDELQLMSTYSYSSTINATIDHYFDAIGNLSKAGVGLGPYEIKSWDAETLGQTVGFVAESGGTRLDVFRLGAEESPAYPQNYWWPILENFLQE
eukprot:m.212638 g.212638  ORF g.212638 m.212638 type:complete len:322 (-) comp26157_c1_seq4:84-1049(-)